MPVFHSLSLTTTVQAFFWEIQENENTLLENLPLSSSDQQLLTLKKRPADRYSFLAVRALLNTIGCEAEVYYDAQGAPFLSDGQQLSITHTHQYVGVVLSQQHNVGIDLEMYRLKIQRIAPRFMHVSESFANTLPLMTQLWTAKEAVYKALRRPGIHFAKQIQVHPFNGLSTTASAVVQLEEGQLEFSLTFVPLHQHCATIALPK